jgi:hypothetical protein
MDLTKLGYMKKLDTIVLDFSGDMFYMGNTINMGSWFKDISNETLAEDVVEYLHEQGIGGCEFDPYANLTELGDSDLFGNRDEGVESDEGDEFDNSESEEEI